MALLRISGTAQKVAYTYWAAIIRTPTSVRAFIISDPYHYIDIPVPLPPGQVADSDARRTEGESFQGNPHTSLHAYTTLCNVPCLHT